MTATPCAGVDGCRGGWVSACRDGRGGLAFAVHARFAALAAALPEGALIAVDMPIGLPERITGPGRAAEQAVRPLLGARASSVFSMVARGAVEADRDFAGTLRLARALSDPPRGLSLQGFNILPRVRDLDAALRADPALAARVRETHPETVLAVGARREGDGMAAPAPRKKTAEGFAARVAVLARAGIDFPVPAPRLAGAARDDLVDAAICLMAAERIAAGLACPHPSPPQRDAHGLPIAIWA